MNWPHSAIAIRIATPAKTVVAASVECVSGASRTASRPTANMALVANKACVRRIRATTRVAGTCANDEEGVDEDDDTDPNGPDRCMRLRIRREDEREGSAAEHHKREGARDQGEQEPIPSNSSETPCALARRRSIREARIRDPDEHNQPEDDERDCVEEVEALERLEVMMGGRDDEARNRRAQAETEVACDSSERGRCGALLRRDQGQGQDL